MTGPFFLLFALALEAGRFLLVPPFLGGVVVAGVGSATSLSPFDSTFNFFGGEDFAFWGTGLASSLLLALAAVGELFLVVSLGLEGESVVLFTPADSASSLEPS